MLAVGTIWSFILPRAINRIGYLRPMLFSCFISMVGCCVNLIGAYKESFPIIVGGTAMAGVQIGSTYYFRLVAVQLAPVEFASVAMSIVLGGGVFAALLGKYFHIKQLHSRSCANAHHLSVILVMYRTTYGTCND